MFLLLESFLGSYPFLMAATIVSFILKAYILSTLILRKSESRNAQLPKILLVLVLISAMIVDSAWFLKLAECLFCFDIGYRIRIFWTRIAWAFSVIQYQSLALFLETLVRSKKNINLRQQIILCISSIFCLLFLGLSIFHFNCFQPNERSLFECKLQQIFTLYLFFPLMAVPLFIAIKKLRTPAIPKILKSQLKLIIQTLIFPHLISDFIQFYPFGFFPAYVASNYAAVSISTITLTFAMYYCIKKIIGLRFLNFRGHVETKTRYNFVKGFKEVLKQLSHATTYKELQHFTQMSFKEMFQIPISRTNLYIRSSKKPIFEQHDISHTEQITENFLILQPNILADYIQKNHIFIYDEIAFSNFYEKSEKTETIINFLDTLNADMFIPIATQEKVIGYIVVDRFARPQEFYSNVEHNEIAVFANYLANIINLLQTRNIEHLVQREKELQEELYNKHQEINQYKESIRSFLRNSRQGDTGIIFYKNRRFTYGNQIAKELLDLNLNQQEGHPVTQKLKNLARKVQEYKTPQSCFTKDKNGQRLVLSAVPHLEQNNVIIVMYYPEISDLVKKQIESLRDPSKWDYLLYLETTASGKMINQLIPSTGEHMLNFKISLLQAALSKKATLLEMPKEDLLPTVRLLHHISLRETLHTIKLTQPCTNNDIATKLFGINPIFGIQSEAPLLEKLDKNGTIFIQNIHYLDPESQEYLAEYLTYGAFRMFKSEQKMASNVRIICSTNTKLSLLVQEGTFSQRLFSQLNKHTLIMPSLLSVPDEEIYELAEGYTEQALKADDFKNLLELTDKEKTKISGARPISLQEFKSKIQQMIQNKSKKNDIYSETQFDPAFEVTDPELIEVARLGKNALRDETAMRLLWRKFKSQSKIASFLSVNRSSVNRRCKQYNLE
jgi:transcriptional regulator with GAF, ATPase, and Fis domain